MRFAKPEIGSNIRVVIPRTAPTHPGYYIPDTVIIGEVVQNEKYDDPHSFRITTGKAYHPVAIVALKRVSEMTHHDGSEANKVEEEKPVVKTIPIAGSNGHEYIVVRNERGMYSCDCKGFSFRKTCKHVNQAKIQLEGSV
jgi:hypothetical protein